MNVEHEVFNNESATDPSDLARRFAIELVELADRYDSLDHTSGQVGGTELQRYCHAARQLARSIPVELAQQGESRVVKI